MTGIQTYKDLEAEKKNLEASLRFHKRLIQADLAGLREELRPLKHALSLIGKLTTKDKSNPAQCGGRWPGGRRAHQKESVKKKWLAYKVNSAIRRKELCDSAACQEKQQFFSAVGRKAEKSVNKEKTGNLFYVSCFAASFILAPSA